MEKQSTRNDNSPILLLLIFFFSGFSSLVYEVVWMRMLSVVFGRTTVAVALVVAVYMAGLGLGSLYWGKRADASKNDIRLFGFLQLGIALTSIVIMLLFIMLPNFFRSICQLFHLTSESSIGVIFLTAFGVLLVPTFLMGGTLPVMTRCYIKNNTQIAQGIGALYGINTFGSIAGAALAGYFFIGSIGQIQTQCVAITVNFIIGCICYLISFKEKEFQAAAAGEGLSEGLKYPVWCVLLIAAVTGFLALSYEILCTRILSIFLVNSTYSFASILVVYLTGITLGSLLFSKVFFKNKNNIQILVLLLMVTGIYVCVVAALCNSFPHLLSTINLKVTSPAAKLVFPGILLSAIFLLVPAVCMGISFPLLCRLYTSSVNEIGNKTAKLYFINTVGSVIGPLFAGFVLLPVVGVVKGLLVVAFLFMLLPLLIIRYDSGNTKKILWYCSQAGIVVAGIFCAVYAVNNSQVYPPSFSRIRGSSDAVLFYKESVSGTVIVREEKLSGLRTLYVNNNAVCGLTYDAMKVVKMLGHVPFLFNPEIKNVLIIGLGAGVTVSEVARHDVKTIDCVEIVPAVKEGATFFTSFNHDVLHNSKVLFHGGDGRNFLLLTDKQYDFISCDPTHPTLGCGNLYTEEYFKLCREHLTEKGVVSQYLPLHRLSLDNFKSIIKTFGSVFPNTTVWLGHSHCVLVGTQNQGATIDFKTVSDLVERLKDPVLDDPYQLASSLFLDNAAANAFTNDAIIHTDNRPFIEFFTHQSTLEENWAINLNEMRRFGIDFTTIVLNITDQQKMMHYMIAQQFYLDGLVKKSEGYKTIADIEKVIELFRKACEVNPENKEIQMFLENETKLYASFVNRK